MRPASRLVVVLVAVLAAGCDRPEAIVICHNSNCVEPPDPSRDDSIESLRESLALEIDGRPVLDGVEIDLFWFGAQDRCIFAHDLADPASSVPAAEVATELANYIAGPEPLSWNGERFTVFIELKAHVGPSKSDAHSPQQRIDHASCAISVLQTLDEAAFTNDRDVEVIFISFDPRLFTALVSHIDWPINTLRVERRLGATIGIPAPLDSQTHSLDEFPPALDIDLVEVHPDWLTEGQYEAYVHADYDLAFWMFSATAEIFDSIERYEPSTVVTNEARLMRRWLEY